MGHWIKLHSLNGFIVPEINVIYSINKLYHLIELYVMRKNITHEYLSMPSNLDVQIITLLSAPPDANFLPSLA